MFKTESYWRKTGAKFIGSEEEFEERYTECSHSMPCCDEESYFSYWLCIKDCKICDFNCSKHLRINPDIQEFVDCLNERLSK